MLFEMTYSTLLRWGACSPVWWWRLSDSILRYWRIHLCEEYNSRGLSLSEAEIENRNKVGHFQVVHDDPRQSDGYDGSAEQCFWIKLSGQNFNKYAAFGKDASTHDPNDIEESMVTCFYRRPGRDISTPQSTIVIFWKTRFATINPCFGVVVQTVALSFVEITC
jgi:hypothetical protein